MTIVTCATKNCGMTFAAPSHWLGERRLDHATFYCPNGHSNFFPQASEEEKLRRERDRLAQRVAERDDAIRRLNEEQQHTTRRLRAVRGVVTRTKRRVGNGVCPCCDRSFGNLQRHMATQHPTYKDAPHADEAKAQT